jgi:protein-S-isoprenylcysteine O-methyltransferase Ste14
MTAETLTLNRALVFGSAVAYWGGVWVQTRRVRRRIGRSANTRPRSTKERLLWAGWFFVVAAWLALPFVSLGGKAVPGTAIIPPLVHPSCRALGIIMMVVGYAGTLWCYAAMGNAWRMGINRAEKTELVTAGPYRVVRHPIYLFQAIMVAAIVLLLPSLLAMTMLVLHLLCVATKAADEEAYLRTLMGQTYETYCAGTGRWFPHLRRRESPPAPLSAAERESLNPAEQLFK